MSNTYLKKEGLTKPMNDSFSFLFVSKIKPKNSPSLHETVEKWCNGYLQSLRRFFGLWTILAVISFIADVIDAITDFGFVVDIFGFGSDGAAASTKAVVIME